MPNSEFAGEVDIPGGEGHVRDPIPLGESHRLKWPLLTLPEQSEGLANEVQRLACEQPRIKADGIRLTVQNGLIEQSLREDAECLLNIRSLFGESVQ